MEDKEVGELWQEALALQDLNNDFGAPTERTIMKYKIIRLIRKLVEERKRGDPRELWLVLKEFGIGLEEWKND